MGDPESTRTWLVSWRQRAQNCHARGAGTSRIHALSSLASLQNDPIHLSFLNTLQTQCIMMRGGMMASVDKRKQNRVYTDIKLDPQKWQKCSLVSGDRLRGQQLGLAMDWVNRLRISADERVLSGRHAVVIV